jgi:PAS domain S-box-containing protein
MEQLDFPPKKPDPLYNEERLAALQESGLLDSAAEEAFDRLTRLAGRLLHAPIALVSLVTSSRQFFKSAAGLTPPWDSRRETPLSHSFCQHVVQTGKPFLVTDALHHPAVRANLAVHELGVVAYCGIPLITSEGHVLGSFCVIDGEAREWTSEEVETMTDLAASVVAEIELRIRTREAEKRTAQLEILHRENLLLQQMQEVAENAQDRLVAILEETSDFVCSADIEGNITYANMALRSLSPARRNDGKRHITDHHPEWAIRVLLDEAVPTALKTGIWSGETAINHPDARYIPLSNVLIAHRSPTGEQYLSLIGRDISERRNTEEGLRESEERFRALADSAPVLIWIADADGKTTYFNRQWLLYTGRTLEQELGYGWAEGLHTEDMLPCREVVASAWATRSEYRMEYRLCRADGSYGWVLETGSPRFAQDGLFLGYIGSCVDVQEQKQALEAVQRSEGRLNAAQKMAHIGNWEYDPKTDDIRWSDETCRIYGRAPGSAPTVEEHIAHIHPDDRERWKKTVFDAMENGRSYEVEFCTLLPDGSTRIVLSNGECRLDDEGKVSAMWGTVQDITERKEAEQERTRLLQILEATPDYVAVTDMKGSLLYLNSTGREILALTEAEVKSHDIRDRYTPSTANLILNVGMPMAQRDGIWMGETIIQAADGRKIPMLQMIQVHRNAEGEPQYFSTIARDITERKRSEEESLRNLRDQAVREAMAKRNQELQALSRRLVEVQEAERTHIARELHDEIGQNLTGLKLTLGAIPRLGEEGKERNLKLAMELTTELMGQVRAMSLDLRPGMLDDLGLLPALQWHLDRYTTQTGVCVEFEEEGLRDRRFNRASETAAYRIVQEALTNVARYADIKAARVRVRVVRDKLHLSIVDQGKGFEPEEVLAAGRSNGLAGMRERALLLGGTFGIQSSSGAGTRLMAELPL